MEPEAVYVGIDVSKTCTVGTVSSPGPIDLQRRRGGLIQARDEVSYE